LIAVLALNLRQRFAVQLRDKSSMYRGLLLCTELLMFSARSVRGWQYGHRKAEKDMITSAESAVFVYLAPTVCISETTLASVDEITKSYIQHQDKTMTDDHARMHARTKMAYF